MCPFPFQGDVVYELTGVYPAQYFFWIDSQSGTVRVSQSLKNDNLRLISYSVSQ